MSSDPAFEWLERHGDRPSARVWVAADLDYFDGHFPDNPILPGIVQIRWALDACEEQWRNAKEFVGMTKIKFKKPVAPATWLDLSLQRDGSSENVRVRFTFREGAQVTTEGVLHFRA